MADRTRSAYNCIMRMPPPDTPSSRAVTLPLHALDRPLETAWRHRLRRWLATGIAWDGREFEPSAEDLAAFHDENIRTSLPRVRALALLLLAFNLVFWTTDGWLLGHISGVQPALGDGRLLATLFGLAALAGSLVPRALLVPYGWCVALGVCAIVGWTMGRMGDPGTPWLHHGYPFLFLPLVAWVRPAHRAALSAATASTLGVAYFGAAPSHLDHPMAGSAIANLAYIAALGAALGAYLDHLRLRVFLLRRERGRQVERLAEQVQAQTAHIQALLDHTETARERERAEVAADLHDELGQMLTGMRCVLKVARERAEAGARSVAVQLEQLALLLQHCTRSVRGVLARMRPQVLEDLGLGAAAEWLVERVTTASGLQCSLELPDERGLERLPRATAAVIYRVLQESLTNVVRHAGASHVQVRLGLDGDRVELSVVDDGVGFEPRERAGGLGILGMTERARACGGELRVESTPGEGSAVRLRLALGGAA